MIISHKYKYVFIQIDQTGSSSIAKELCEFYDGKEILFKHATYGDFLKTANSREKEYFAFSGIRNPLDVVVSIYFRHKFDPRKRFSENSDKSVTPKNLEMYNFIKQHNASFDKFFMKFYSESIYKNWKMDDFDNLGYIYKFENLQEDFSKILKKLKIAQVRPLPNRSINTGRKSNFEDYYDRETQQISQIVFSNFMLKYGYSFPSNWKKPGFYLIFIYRPLLSLKYLFQLIYHYFNGPILINKLNKVYK